MTPEGQHELAREIVENFKGGEIIVLAGMSAEPERKDIFAVTSNAEYRIALEKQGVDVRRGGTKQYHWHGSINHRQQYLMFELHV